MKIRIKHPVLVNVKAARSDKVTKTPLTVTTTFDIPQFGQGEAVEALSYRKRKHVSPTVVYERDGTFFRAETLPEGLISGHGGPSAVSGMNMKEISIAASHRLYAHAAERVGTDRVIATKLLDQPDVHSLPRDRVEWADFEAEMTLVHRLVGNYGIIGKHLYHHDVEPFYAITSSYNSTQLNIVSDNNVPEDMIAAFRLGRLEDARAFGRRLAEYRRVEFGTQCTFNDIENVVEGENCISEFDDIGLTIAVAACKAVKNFRHSFNHEYQGKAHIDELVFRTPLDELALVREIDSLTGGRGFHHLTKDADQLGELVERAMAFGVRSKFSRGADNPLKLIHELWSDQEISISPAKALSP